MRRLYMKLLLIFLTTGIFAQSITLEKAIEMALQNQPGIRAEKASVQSSKYLKRKALGNFLPEISSSIRYYHLKNDIVLDLNPIREGIISLHAQNAVDLQNLNSLIQTGIPLTPEQQQMVYQQAFQQLDQAFPSFSEKFKNQNYWSGQVQFMQPLWTWGKIWSAYKIATYDEKIAHQNLSLKEQKVIVEVVDAYFLNQLLQSLVEVKEKTVESLAQHEHNAKRMYEEGLIAKVEYLRAATALEKEKAELEKARHDLSVARDYLKSKIYTEFSTLDENIKFPSYQPSQDSLLQSLQKQQPYFQILDLTESKLKRKIHIDISENLPTIYAFGNYELFKNDLSILEPEWLIGIGLKWDIFHGFQKVNQLQSDRYLKKKVQYTRQELRENLEIAIKKTYAEMQFAKNNYQALDKALELAQENVKLNRKKFETGLGTSLEVVDAELTLQKVKIARLKEMYTYNKKFAQVLYLSGNVYRITDYF